MHDALYQARILDHYKNPRHKGALVDADRVARGSNPLCGDMLTVYVRLDGDTIVEATFEGEGCAISQASASLLMEKLAGMSKKKARALTEVDIYALLGVEVSIGRQKCALLAWRALQDALKNLQP
ncbi:MAG: SUF system NifU family Fe-S cluster assembly protein [Candidatus Pacebacteria bacterium]|nr:SUF system NifU family Fe-S cluster assembly protein [Candidatus Paceibacterota bacterium]